jgi:transposase
VAAATFGKAFATLPADQQASAAATMRSTLQGVDLTKLDVVVSAPLADAIVTCETNSPKRWTQPILRRAGRRPTVSAHSLRGRRPTSWCSRRLVSVRRLLDSLESLGFDGAHLDSRGLPLWTDKNRAKYDRDHLRYPSDLTDDEWACVEPLIPPAKLGGGKRRTDMRAVMNGVMYILSTGCQWRYIPKDFPPRSTLHDYFTWWICDGTLDRIHHALYVECRDKAEREASPTACIIDSQSVKSAEKGGPVLILTGLMQAN